MALLGSNGLRNVAAHCIKNTDTLKNKLTELDGLKILFDDQCFHEFVVQVQRPADAIIADMAAKGYVAGVNISDDYPALGQCLLLCVTETKTEDDLDEFVAALSECL